MKSPNRLTVSRLDALPNIGPKIAKELELIGIDHPNQLIGRSPYELYMELCSARGEHVDYCVLDVFMSAVDFMEGAEAKSWWAYTDQRKLMIQRIG